MVYPPPRSKKWLTPTWVTTLSFMREALLLQKGWIFWNVCRDILKMPSYAQQNQFRIPTSAGKYKINPSSHPLKLLRELICFGGSRFWADNCSADLHLQHCISHRTYLVIVLNVFRSCYLNRWFWKFCIYFSTIDILGPGQHLNTFTAERMDVLGCA